MDEQTTATPEAVGASVQDRLERFLAADDAPAQTSETPQGESQPEATQSAQTSDEPSDDGQSQEQQPQLTTADLAKVLGIDESALDVDEDGSIKVKTKIDGAEGAAKFADLLKSYQLEGHVNKKSMEVAEREKALQTRAQEVEQATQARLQEVEGLIELASRELLGQYQSVDWNALRQQDPGQYAALRADFEGRRNQLLGAVQQVKARGEQAKFKESETVWAKVAEEEQRLPSLIPEWKSPEVRAKESVAISQWAVQAGIPQSTLHAVSEGALANAAVVAALRKAWLHDQLQASKPAIENKVRIAPKIVRPGQAQQNSAQQNLQSLKQNVRKSGGKGDSVAAYLLASGKV